MRFFYPQKQKCYNKVLTKSAVADIDKPHLEQKVLSSFLVWPNCTPRNIYISTHNFCSPRWSDRRRVVRGGWGWRGANKLIMSNKTTLYTFGQKRNDDILHAVLIDTSALVAYVINRSLIIYLIKWISIVLWSQRGFIIGSHREHLIVTVLVLKALSLFQFYVYCSDFGNVLWWWYFAFPFLKFLNILWYPISTQPAC